MKLQDQLNKAVEISGDHKMELACTGFDLNQMSKSRATAMFDLNESYYVDREEDDADEVVINEGRNEKVRKFCARGHWRPVEDAKLTELVLQFGPQNWNLIAEHLPERSGKSCRLRWFNQLDPKINKKPFTDEEEEKLLESHKLYGNKWAMISKLFPGRTDNAVKNHWHVIMARKQREDQQVVRVYKRLRTNPISANNFVACSDDSTVTTVSNARVELTLTPTSVRANQCLMSGSVSEGSALDEEKKKLKVFKDGWDMVGETEEAMFSYKNKNSELIDFLGLGIV